MGERRQRIGGKQHRGSSDAIELRIEMHCVRPGGVIVREGISGGLGLLVLNDKAGEGTLTSSYSSLIYAYQLNITREFSIRTGLQATYAQKTLDVDKLTFGDQIDPRYGFI